MPICYHVILNNKRLISCFPLLHCSHVGCICHDGYSGDFCEYPSSSKGSTTGTAGKVLLSLLMIGVLLALLLSILVSRGRRARNGPYGNNTRQFFPVTQASSRDGEAPIREMSWGTEQITTYAYTLKYSSPEQFHVIVSKPIHL